MPRPLTATRGGVHTERPTIVSIQSQLVFGCAGNSAAVPLLQKLGARVYAVPTTILSNTPHYPSVAGGPLAAETVEGLLSTLLERVDAEEIDGVITGYMARAETVGVTARFLDAVRRRKPDLVYLCDPVIGDTDCGAYVAGDIAGAIAGDLVPRADIVTPNVFEARCLIGGALVRGDGPERDSDGFATGVPDGDPGGGLDIDGLAAALLALGPKTAVITGHQVRLGLLETICRHHSRLDRVTTRRLPIRPTGTGDLFAAAFLWALLRTGEHAAALRAGVEAVYGLMAAAVATGAQELDPTMDKAPVDAADADLKVASIDAPTPA